MADEYRYAITDCADVPEINTATSTHADNSDSENKVKVLTESECVKVFPMSLAISTQARAFASLSRGDVIVPDRLILSIPGSATDAADADMDTLFKPACSKQSMVYVHTYT